MDIKRHIYRNAMKRAERIALPAFALGAGAFLIAIYKGTHGAHGDLVAGIFFGAIGWILFVSVAMEVYAVLCVKRSVPTSDN